MYTAWSECCFYSITGFNCTSHFRPNIITKNMQLYLDNLLHYILTLLGIRITPKTYSFCSNSADKRKQKAVPGFTGDNIGSYPSANAANGFVWSICFAL